MQQLAAGRKDAELRTVLEQVMVDFKMRWQVSNCASAAERWPLLAATQDQVDLVIDVPLGM